eukprot:680545-Rhodomonas_salina.2
MIIRRVFTRTICLPARMIPLTPFPCAGNVCSPCSTNPAGGQELRAQPCELRWLPAACYSAVPHTHAAFGGAGAVSQWQISGEGSYPASLCAFSLCDVRC